MVSAYNYIRNFDFVLNIWSQLHDKDCLYILLSSKNSLSYTGICRDRTLSLSYILTSRSQLHENVYIL